MEKTGEVREGLTPCDACGKPSTVRVGKRCFCIDHVPVVNFSKRADMIQASSESLRLKSFTTPIKPKD